MTFIHTAGRRRKTHINRVTVKVRVQARATGRRKREHSPVCETTMEKKKKTRVSAKVHRVKQREVDWVSSGRGVPDSECCVSKLSPTLLVTYYPLGFRICLDKQLNQKKTPLEMSQ